MLKAYENISLFKHIVESMNEMVCVVDSESNVIFSNSKMERVIGTKIDRKCPGKMDSEKCENCLAHVCLEQGRPQSMIYEQNGRVYNVSISPIRYENNKFDYALEVWTDITGEKRLREQLTAQNNMLKNDLKLASALQQSMLPCNISEKDGIKFDMMYLPCEDVGGDFYDVFYPDDYNIVFYIADVSGHGVSAAMLTVFFSQAVKSVVESKNGDYNPAEILDEVWKKFMKTEIQEHLYVTAWMAVYNIKESELSYSNAGHIISPIMLHSNEIKSLENTGYPICRWIPKTNYQTKKIVLTKGDRLLLYTDGLSDAWRSMEAVRISSKYDTPDQLAQVCLKKGPFEDILNDIWSQISPDAMKTHLSDDIAMLLLEKNN